jgi:acyl-coenzyme A synthetase/AMP-(fatty) acid ligase
MLPAGNSYDEVPRQIEFVTELPLTATGKIRRKALHKWELQRHHG